MTLSRNRLLGLSKQNLKYRVARKLVSMNVAGIKIDVKIFTKGANGGGGRKYNSPVHRK